jgi:hypothetical protein
MPKHTVLKPSYGYGLQARKNFSDEPEMRHATLTENARGKLNMGMNKAGLAVM